MYGRNKKILGFILAFWSLQQVAALLISLHSSVNGKLFLVSYRKGNWGYLTNFDSFHPAKPRNSIPGALYLPQSLACMLSRINSPHKLPLGIAWLPALCFETVLFCMVCYKAKELVVSGGRRRILRTLFHDRWVIWLERAFCELTYIRSARSIILRAFWRYRFATVLHYPLLFRALIIGASNITVSLAAPPWLFTTCYR